MQPQKSVELRLDEETAITAAPQLLSIFQDVEIYVGFIEMFEEYTGNEFDLLRKVLKVKRTNEPVILTTSSDCPI